jgi:hypothetical protein
MPNGVFQPTGTAIAFADTVYEISKQLLESTITFNRIDEEKYE